MGLILWVVALTCLLTDSAKARPDSGQEDMSQVDIYLHTLDVGDMYYTNFGHTALRVIDGNRDTDLIYNWGMFDFGEPLSFALRFYQGELNYKLGVYPSRYGLRSYRFEGRKAWEDLLDLTPDQKRILLDGIRYNNRPENRVFSYHYFFDNCTTRVRDFIDKALSGKLKEKNKGDTGITFRAMVREGFQYNPEMDLVLEIGMNGRIDRSMTGWEMMFHPLVLRDELLNMTIDGKKLIKKSRVLVDFPEPGGTPHIFMILAAVLLVPIGSSVYLLQKVALQKYRKQEISQSSERFGLRLLGLTGLPLIGFLGFCGVLMPINWLFSGHEDLHHNLNMMFFLPTDIVLVGLAIYLLFKARPYPCSIALHTLAKRYVLLHIGLAVGGALSFSMGLSVQDLGRVIYIAVPYVLVIALMVNFGLRIESSGAHERPSQSH